MTTIVRFQKPGVTRGQDILVFADHRWRLNSTATTFDQSSGGAVARSVKASQNHVSRNAGYGDATDRSKRGSGYKRSDPSAISLSSPVPSISGNLVIAKLPQQLTAAKMSSLGGGLADRFAVSGEGNVRRLTIDFGLRLLSEKLDDHAELVSAFLVGLCLRGYRFDRYFTELSRKMGRLEVTVRAGHPDLVKQRWLFDGEPTVQGVTLARDLATEPANHLYPESYAQRIAAHAPEGLSVKIFDDQQLQDMGFHALLAVAKGSVRPARMVQLEWNGTQDKKAKPLVFVGKGVTFDTGGISLKPARNMEDMKYDMSGSAVVVGLMQLLALRRAPVRAVGLVGLVENMPDGGAMVPGDVIGSHDGQTIEVLNTDAEGRLVLVDLLSYAQKSFAPELVVNLATLTGAIVISLADVYGGLFSNDDGLARELEKSGRATGELVWRMPMHDQIDTLMNSTIADVRNIESRSLGAQSSAAAHFLHRFVDPKIRWAHLDIAGVSWRSRAFGVHPNGASGWGVRVLDQLIRSYE